MRDEAYCYPPDFTVLRNKFGIHDAEELDSIEREFVTRRSKGAVPSGKFDLTHLKAIHRHLFQDIYDWAGQVRTVEISKGGSQFQFRRYIETGMADVHRRLVAGNFLKKLDLADFAVAVGPIMGDVNYVHPFREGNGRTQMIYLKQLTAQADHAIDLTLIERDTWMNASRQAHMGRYDAMSECVAAALTN